MPISGTLGSKLYISTAAIVGTIDTEAEFAALSWTEVKFVENFGEVGKVFDLVTFQAVADGRTYKLKGAYNGGSLQVIVGLDLSDPGQLQLKTIAENTSQANYGIKIEFNDSPSPVGGPSAVYFQALPMSFRTNLASVNNVVKATTSVEVNSEILQVGAADLRDFFVNGESLAAYALFAGSDGQAVAPAVSGNALAGTTGDAGTGYAADGTQAIGLTGYTLSGGAVTLEARLKTSAITNVSLFFGLTDQNAALEAPIESAASADTITTNATDAVGFMFDTSMATDNIWLVGVNNNVDETAQNAGLALVADTYKTLRLEIDASGNADFFVDGVQVGVTMATACRTSVPLYPTIAAAARSTASRTVTVDNLYLRQD